MPGTQACGTHAFDPGAFSSHSATNIINAINEEEDGAEDRVDPVDLPVDKTPAAQAAMLFPFVNPDLSNSSSSSVISSFFPPPNLSASSSSGARPLQSSSLPASADPRATPDASMSSIYSGSNVGQKRKHTSDVKSISSRRRSAGGSLRSSRSKTKDLNPIIISSALNSTLNRMADVMERSLDATAAAITTSLSTAPSTILSVAPPGPPTITPPAASQLSPSPSQPLGPSSSSSFLSSTSSTKILELAIDVISADDSLLSDDELLAASLFFTNVSEETVCVAHTFISLGNNRVVQRRFLVRQLEIAALLPGKGKGKAVEDDDHSMEY